MMDILLPVFLLGLFSGFIFGFTFAVCGGSALLP